MWGNNNRDMTIHIDPNADIIQQLKDLSEILSVKEVIVSVSEKQLEIAKENISCPFYWADKGMVNSYVVHIGAVSFYLTTSQQFSGNRIRFNEENKI